MNKTNYLFLYLFSLTFSVAGEIRTPIDMLRLLQENNSWCYSVSCEIQTRYFPTSKKGSYGDIDISFIRDNNRCEAIGNCTVYEDGLISEEASHAKFDVMDGKRFLYAIGASKDVLFQGSIKETGYQENLFDVLNDPDRGSPLWGRIFGNRNLDIYEILSNASNLSYNVSDNKIAGKNQCYELKGSSALGTVTIFLSPQQGMIPLRWVIEKGPDDYFNDNLLKKIGIKSWKVSYDASDIKKIGDCLTPAEGRMEFFIEYDNGKMLKNVYEYTVKNTTINPDFETLGAFKFDLPSNVRVYLETAPGIVYNFYGGKLLPEINQDYIDMLGDATEQIKREVKSKVVESINKTAEISNKETPVSTDMPAAMPTVENVKQKGFSDFSAFSVSALIVAGVIVVGIGVWLVFRLVKRGGHVES